MSQHEINKQICKVLNEIMIRNPTTPIMMDEQKKLIKMVMDSQFKENDPLEETTI